MNWTKKETDLLKDNYGKITTQELSPLLANRSIQTIIAKANSLKLTSNLRFQGRHRKYSFNETYFSIPNINNCYWAGFIAGDGYIGYTGPSSYLYLGIKQSDKDILKNFQKEIKYNGKIIDKSKYDKRTNKFYNKSIIKISDKSILTNDLNKHWNITTNKSFTLQPPNITDINLCLSYIIGYIDADGCIDEYTHKNRKKSTIRLTIVGGKDIINWISTTLYKLENKDKYNSATIIRQNKIYRISYSAKRAQNILKQLYQIQTPYKLERKWKKILE